MRNLRIVVLGGGIGGLTAAAFLGRAGYDVTLYERAPEITPIGAGISLWPNGVKVMHWLGVGDELSALAPPMRTLRYVSPRGQELKVISLTELERAAGQRVYPIARTDLQFALLRRLDPEQVILGATCVSAEQTADEVRLHFDDGCTVKADLLVAADGVRSVVRELVTGRAWPPRYAGNVNWNGLIEFGDDLGPRDAFTLIVGDGRRCGFMPVSGGRAYFFFDAAVVNNAAVERGEWRSELEEQFAGWEGPARSLIRRFDESRMVRQPMCDLDPLPRLVAGRVALLGDAAHAATPMLGQGAAMAMEDAEILTRCLVTTDAPVPQVLERYQAQRIARVHDIGRQSRARTRLMIAADPAATSAWYEQLRQANDNDVVAAIAEIVLTGPFG